MATLINKDTLRITRGVLAEDYEGNPNYLVNPTIPAGVPEQYLVIVGNTVREMIPAEKRIKDIEIQTAIDLAAVAADRAAKIRAFAAEQAEAAAIAAEVISE